MMTASARHAETPHAADALHKMAAAAAREDRRPSAAGDENAPANGNKPSSAAKKPKSKDDAPPKQQSESDENADDDDDEEDDDEDNETGKAKSVASSSAATDKTGDDDDKKASKKSRRELPPHTVAILKGWMLSPEHVKHPYPTDEDKQMLLKKTGINMKQLTNWFTNARKRIWKPMMRREHSRQLQTAMEYEKTRGGVPGGVPGGAPYAMAPPPMGGYRDGVGAYPPRPAIRHSFDAGSLGAPPPHAYAHAYDGSMPMAPPPHPHAQPPPPHMAGAYAPPPGHAYPPRVVRSVSESATRHDMDDYIDAMRIRKRVHEMAPDGVDGDGAHADKRFRRASALSPRCTQILHEWVAAHAHMEYPTPADADKLQLSRDTGLDVQQIELWFKTNVGRHGALLQPQQQPQQPPQQQPPQAPMPHGHPAYRSIPSRDNPLYPPPPAYGERRSIPSHGNPMFPPRPNARSSIPGAGNPQFPPPPGVRRDSSDGFRGGMPPPPGYPGTNGVYPPPAHQGYDAEAARPMRTLSINSAQYASSSGSAAVPMTSIPTPVGAPGAASGLPSLTGRPLPGGAAGGRPGPPMGQARDSRSHTLDMGQFADARRRKMNFQDILASTSGPQMPHGLPAARPPLGGGAPPSTEVPAPYAQKMYEQQQQQAQQQQQRAGMAAPPGSADAPVQGSRI